MFKIENYHSLMFIGFPIHWYEWIDMVTYIVFGTAWSVEAPGTTNVMKP